MIDLTKNNLDEETYQALMTITGELQVASLNIQNVKSLLAFLSDYFRHDNPNPNILINRYSDYSNLLNATFDIISKESENTSVLLNNLETTLYSLRKHCTSGCD